MTGATDTGKEFIASARHHLVVEYLPKITACVAELGEEDFWWRASESENSAYLNEIGGAIVTRNRRLAWVAPAAPTVPTASIW